MEDDAVVVRMLGSLTTGVTGRVLSVREGRLCIWAHSLDSPSVKGATQCADEILVIPWSAIAFVAHTKTRPVGCACSGGVR